MRVIGYLLLAVVLISLIRGVIGILMKGLGELVAPQRPRTGSAQGAPQEEIPLSGELKKDPVCGTYTSAATSISKKVGKETVYFCSAQCRDKYVASH